jgi:hypothetical protein
MNAGDQLMFTPNGASGSCVASGYQLLTD